MGIWRLTIEANDHTFYVRHERDYYHVVYPLGAWPSFADLTEARSLARQMARRIIDATGRSDLVLGDDTTDMVQSVSPAHTIEVVCSVLVRIDEQTWYALARDHRQYDSDAHRAFETSAKTFAKPRKRPTIERCPVCNKPGHPGETDDLGRHPECQPKEGA